MRKIAVRRLAAPIACALLLAGTAAARPSGNARPADAPDDRVLVERSLRARALVTSGRTMEGLVVGMLAAAPVLDRWEGSPASVDGLLLAATQAVYSRPIAQLRSHGTHASALFGLALAPDGTWLAAMGDDGVSILDAETGAVRTTVEGDTNLAISRDGRYLLTASGEGTARIHEAATGRLVRNLEEHGFSVGVGAWSPDGQLVVSVDRKDRFWIWDVATGRSIRTLPGRDFKAFFPGGAFSPDGKWIVTWSGEAVATIWEAQTGKLAQGLVGHGGGVTSAAFSADGKRVLTASEDRTARLWDASTGRLLHTFWGHGDTVRSAAFSPDGNLVVTTSADGTFRLWDLFSTPCVCDQKEHWNDRLLRVLGDGRSTIVQAVFSPDGQHVFTGSADGILRRWDVREGQLVLPIGDRVFAAAYSRDGRIVATGGPDGARVEEVGTGRLLRSIAVQPDSRGVNAVALSPDGRRLVTSETSSVASGARPLPARLFEIGGDRPPIALEQSEALARATFSPDGKLVVGDRFGAPIWDAETGRLLRRLNGTERSIEVHAFSPDGRLLAAGDSEGGVRLREIEGGRVVRTLEPPEAAKAGWIQSVAFSPDGALVAIAGGDTVRIREASTGRLARTLDIPSVESAAFSPDGRFMVTTAAVVERPDVQSPRSAIWEWKSGRLLRALEELDGTLGEARFSADGRTVLVGAGRPRLWPWRPVETFQFGCRVLLAWDRLPRVPQADLDAVKAECRARGFDKSPLPWAAPAR